MGKSIVAVRLAALAAACCLTPAASALAAAGDLDTAAYNSPNGFVRSDWTPQGATISGAKATDIVRSPALSATDRTVTAGAVAVSSTSQTGAIDDPGGTGDQTPGNAIGLVAHSSAGSLDTSFGVFSSGKNIVRIWHKTVSEISIARQSDGKLVVAGVVADAPPLTNPPTPPAAGSQVFVTRFNVDGSLDTGFGSNGRVYVFNANADDTVSRTRVLVDSGDAIWVGYSLQTHGTDTTQAAMARFSPSGSTTATTAVAHSGSTHDFAGNIALQSDGKVVQVGDRYDPNGISVIHTVKVFRYAFDSGTGFLTAPATLDTSGLPADYAGRAIGVQPGATAADDKILVGADRGGGSNSWLVARIDLTGAPDTSFNTTGWNVFPMGDTGTNSVMTDMMLSVGGSATLAGRVTNSTRKFGLARTTSAGALDSAFGSSGKSYIAISDLAGAEASPPNSFFAPAFATQTDGKALFASTVKFVNQNGVSVNQYVTARFLTSGSSPPPPQPAHLTVTPASTEFGTVTVGQTSSGHDVTLTNDGGSSLNVADVSTQAPFSLNGSDTPCETTLAAGQSCVVHATYSPTSAGESSGTVSVSYSIGGIFSNTSVSLHGTGQAAGGSTTTTTGSAPAVKLSTIGLQFGGVPPGELKSLPVTLTNTGGAPLEIGEVTTLTQHVGPNVYAETDVSPCKNKTLAPGASCTITVKARPDGEGLRNGTLTFKTNAPGSPHILAMGLVGTTMYGPRVASVCYPDGLRTGPTLDGIPYNPNVTHGLVYGLVDAGGLDTEVAFIFGEQTGLKPRYTLRSFDTFHTGGRGWRWISMNEQNLGGPSTRRFLAGTWFGMKYKQTYDYTTVAKNARGATQGAKNCTFRTPDGPGQAPPPQIGSVTIKPDNSALVYVQNNGPANILSLQTVVPEDAAPPAAVVNSFEQEARQWCASRGWTWASKDCQDYISSCIVCGPAGQSASAAAVRVARRTRLKRIVLGSVIKRRAKAGVVRLEIKPSKRMARALKRLSAAKRAKLLAKAQIRVTTKVGRRKPSSYSVPVKR